MLTEQERTELASVGTHFGAMVTIAGHIADEREARTREAIAVGIEAWCQRKHGGLHCGCRHLAAIARAGGAS